MKATDTQKRTEPGRMAITAKAFNPITRQIDDADTQAELRRLARWCIKLATKTRSWPEPETGWGLAALQETVRHQCKQLATWADSEAVGCPDLATAIRALATSFDVSFATGTANANRRAPWHRACRDARIVHADLIREIAHTIERSNAPLPAERAGHRFLVSAKLLDDADAFIREQPGKNGKCIASALGCKTPDHFRRDIWPALMSERGFRKIPGRQGYYPPLDADREQEPSDVDTTPRAGPL